MFRALGNLVSPKGSRARLAILTYHRALEKPDPVLCDEIDAAVLDAQLAALASDFNVLPLQEACLRLERGTLPARAVSITFDDGYADNLRVALPLLQRHRLPAAFFIATGYSSGSCMFNDVLIHALRAARPGAHDLSAVGLPPIEVGDAASRRRALTTLIGALKYRGRPEREDMAAAVAGIMRVDIPKNLMLTPEEIVRLHRAGMEIGAHTVTHPILAAATDDEARREIVTSKRVLEEITGAPVRLFAYPNGKPGRDYDTRHVRMVRDAGYSAAVSTMQQTARRGADLFQLPRLDPWERNPRKFAARLLLAYARARAGGVGARNEAAVPV